jgi:3',5'-cyclic-AMP phosphodiesterase
MNRDLRFLVLSDPHLFANPGGTLRGINTLNSLRRVLGDVIARKLAFDAVICTGDIVNDEPEGYTHFARELAALDKPVYCIPGNHDDPALLSHALAAPPFQVGGHVDLGTWRIVLLDSCLRGAAGGHLADSELQSLDAALSGNDRYAMICVHHHPVSMGSRWLDAVGIDNAAALFEVLDAHAQVRAILWGHVHQCFDARRHGVRLLATPSTGAQFLPRADNFAVDARPSAYRRLTLHEDGTLDTEVTWLDEADTTGLPARSA